MSGPTPDLPPRRPPFGLLGMLVLVAAVELIIGGRRLDFTTVWADDWRRAALEASRVKGRDVLCFGDSLVKFGVLPGQIEAKTGLRSYNLAVNAGTMPSAYFLLRRSLDSGARPKAIVADFFALMLPDKPDDSIRLYPDLATAGECLDLAWTARDPGFLHSTLLGKLLPSYKCRFEIRQSIRGALAGHRASPWPRQSALWATWKAQDGAQPMPSIGVPPAPNPALAANLSPGGWACDAINAAYCEKFLALAESRKIPVFWLMPPLSPDVHALRKLNGTDDAYTRFARLALGRHPGVVVLDARRSGYEGSVYIDPIHLDHRGARVLTGDLARVVADRLKDRGPAPRWVDLPPFAGRSVDETARDVARVGKMQIH